MRFKYTHFFPDLPEQMINTLAEICSKKKQIASICILSLFLLIQGVKLLHTHEHDSVENIKGQKELISKFKHCDICDYHCGTALAAPTYTSYSSNVINIPSYFNFYRSVSITSTGLSYTDRGPPTAF